MEAGEGGEEVDLRQKCTPSEDTGGQAEGKSADVRRWLEVMAEVLIVAIPC